ncbi:hypothetical protein [Microbacterium sp.]|uniref:hypothetical protein n=1 Tax=Microbacterium sp. TaxID=51671 RepID=UPI002810A094|nr:hypothetical protein [Microbacterium sp.]
MTYQQGAVMAFGPRDLRRGMIAAWLVFLTETSVFLVAQGLTSASPPDQAVTALVLYGLPIVAIASGLTVLFAAPAAWLLGRLLTRVTRVALHVVALGALGALAGTVAVLVMTPSRPQFTALMTPTALWIIAMAAVAAAAGWAWAARRVQRGRRV